MYTEESTGEAKIKRDKIINLITSMANEMALMPEMAMLLDSRAETPSSTIERFRKNVLGNADIRIKLEDLSFQKQNGIIVQNTGQTRMTAVQGFAATRHLVKDSGTTSAPAVNIDLQAAIFSNISLTILDSIEDGQELRATIAHELGHLFFEYAYPAIAHSEKKTAAGLTEGEAMSEGAALLVEQTYLRKYYGYELGSAIFEKFHPFDNPHAPYGKYAAYFRDTFTEKAKVFKDDYPKMITELLEARNNVIVSEIVLDHAERNKNLATWKDCTTPTYLVIKQQNRVASRITGYIRNTRTEHSIAAAIGKNEEASRSTKRCAQDIIELEEVSLQVNNSITGRELTSLFSRGDRCELIVHDNTNGVNQMMTETLALFYGSEALIPPTNTRTTSSILVKAHINISSTEPDYNKLLSDMKANKLAPHTGNSAAGSAIDIDATHKIIKQAPAITRNGNIVHELSHLYFARIYPAINSPLVREGYAMYAELSYYILRLKNMAYSEADSKKFAAQLMMLKYELNTTIPSETLDVLKSQHASLTHFVHNFVTTESNTPLLKVNTMKLNQLEQKAIKQRYKFLLN